NLVGRSLDDARVQLERLQLEADISWVDGTPGAVLEQKPKAGLAAAPGLKVRLVVARG
ncbi:MAG: PASTA domain-containing protein, partial [Actinobacteria bacterium]|nr:PASTA domain-containing protein [Actinomycetota bacterium]